jgi:hypothetical protein
MSELSSAYTEYERMATLFRQLNEATLVTRRILLGINPPSLEQQISVRDQLDAALQSLAVIPEVHSAAARAEAISLGEILRQLPANDDEITPKTVTRIREHIKDGLKSLTEDDLKVMDRITSALDSATEVLFRRIQR